MFLFFCQGFSEDLPHKTVPDWSNYSWNSARWYDSWSLLIQSACLQSIETKAENMIWHDMTHYCGPKTYMIMDCPSGTTRAARLRPGGSERLDDRMQYQYGSIKMYQMKDVS